MKLFHTIIAEQTGPLLLIAIVFGTGVLAGTRSSPEPEPPVEEERALSDAARKQALYEELKAGEPSPDHWMNQPESARRAADRIQAAKPE